MVEINVKLEENSTVSQFTHGVARAIEEYLLKVHKDTLDRIQMIEGKILNYYKLHGDENFKDYFGIVDNREGTVNDIQEAEVVEEKPKMRIVKEEDDIIY